MDSGSDWDSLTGDEPSFVDVSVHNSKRSNKQKKEALPENFDGRGVYNQGFQSVELEDRSRINDAISAREKKQRKGYNLKSSEQEDLPYTQFSASSNTKKHTKASTNKKSSGNDSNTIQQKQKASYTLESPMNKRDSIDEKSWDLQYNSRNGKKDSLYGESIIEIEKEKPLKNDDNNNVQTTKPLQKQIMIPHEAYFTSPTVLSFYENKNKESLVDENNEKRFFYESCYYNMYRSGSDQTLIMKKYSDKLEPNIKRIWEEVFSAIRIILDFFVIFILESIKLVFIIIFQRLLVGFITSLGDHVLKPLFSSLFNSILQPLFVFIWNITRGVRRFLQPVVFLISDILQPASGLFRSFRLFEYRNERMVMVSEEEKHV